MKYYYFFALILLSTAVVNAQQTDSTGNPWNNKGIVSLNISQISFTDWTQGGDNAITYTILGNFSFDYSHPTWTLKNALKVAYGQTKIANDDFKTNDNELFLESVYSRDFDIWVDPFISNIVRTTIAPGYSYANDTVVQIGAFFDPGYISQSIGLGINKSDLVQTRIGLAFQETFTNKFTQYSDDITTAEVESFKFETGIEAVTDFNWNFMENMLFKSKLRLFTRFEHLDVWDVRWDNAITAQINKYIVVNLTALIIHEKSQSTRTQIKQALQLGITYSLF